MLLDNQAGMSIMHPSMLEDVKACDHKLSIKGVGGAQFMFLDQGCTYQIFFKFMQENEQRPMYYTLRGSKTNTPIHTYLVHAS